MHKFLRSLASLKLAIYLLAAMAGLYAVAAVYGDMEIYSSWMFRLLMAVFWLNLFSCTVLHLPGAWRISHRKAKADFASSGYENIAQAENCSQDEITAVLKKMGFKMDTAENEQGICIFAQKGKASLFAPHVLHLAILIIIIGAFLVSFAVSGAVICTDGQKVALPSAVAAKIGEGYEIVVEKFETVYDDQGAVDNWVTTLDLTKDGEVVASGQSMVNHPLIYKDLTIYQNSYKYHFLLSLEGVNAEADGVYSLPEDLAVDVSDDLTLIAHGLSDEEVFVHVRYKGEEETYTLKLGEVFSFKDGITLEYGGENNYTILQVKYAQGSKVVFLGFIIACLASIMLWSSRYREIYLRKAKNGVWQCRVYCKSPEIMQRMKKDFASNLGGGNLD